MNSVKYFLLFLCFVCTSLFAEDVPFSVSGSPSAAVGTTASLDDPEQQTALISELKLKAVSEWLQGYLGNRYPQYEKAVNTEFAEKYVLDYKVGRTGANREQLLLTGHLDGTSLKKWIRVSETKKGTTTVKPLFILSSNLPGLSFTPNQTSEKTNQLILGQITYQFMNQEFQRLNTTVTPLDSVPPTNQPPRFESDIRALRDYGIQSGTNVGVWVHFGTCPSCQGGARTDIYLYGFQGSRLFFVESDDLNLRPADYASHERVKAALAPVLQQFRSSFEGLVAEGRLLSQTYRLQIEGLDSYRNYKYIESELLKSDFASQPILKRSEARVAEFEIMSSLNADELTQRIQEIDLRGKKLAPQRIDSNRIVMRYSK